MYSVAIEFNWYSYNNSYGAIYIARAGDDHLRTIIHLLIIVYIYIYLGLLQFTSF